MKFDTVLGIEGEKNTSEIGGGKTTTTTSIYVTF
jgi:hypothetical protein